ncbi:hypothetical protein NMY22_g8907 [Coprinellus aureogranulatus]|nr:hypothetical protein NMY22_g8907 [Coprinellus aureogranulatus]
MMELGDQPSAVNSSSALQHPDPCPSHDGGKSSSPFQRLSATHQTWQISLKSPTQNRTMSAHFSIASSTIAIAAFAVFLAGVYIYAACLQARRYRNLETQLETALHQLQVRDSQILVLTSTNKGLIGEILALLRTKGPEFHLPPTRNHDGWSTQWSAQQLEELSKENAQLRTSLAAAKAELALRNRDLKTSARAQEDVERHRSEREQKILELEDKLSECHRRLARKASLHLPMVEVPLEEIIALSTRTTPGLVITHRHSRTDSAAKRSQTDPVPEAVVIEVEKGMLGGRIGKWVGRVRGRR